MLCVGITFPSVALAQADAEDPMEEEARLVYEAGTVAFADARYEEALERFRTAYELSPRVRLQYNIGLAADRLRRDDEALAAFELFLRDSPPDAQGVADAEVRVRVLRAQPPPTAGEPTASEPTASEPEDEGSGRAVVGPLLVAAAGLGLIAVPIVGAVTTDSCSAMDGGVCVAETRVDVGPAVAYAIAGGVALIGALLWWLLSGDAGQSNSARLTVRRGLVF